MKFYNPIKKFKAFLTLESAIKQAEESYAKKRCRYYVMPQEGGKLVVFDRQTFRIMKRKGYIDQSYNMKDVEYTCFYATPYRNGKEYSKKELNIKRKEFYEWYFSKK